MFSGFKEFTKLLLLTLFTHIVVTMSQLLLIIVNEPSFFLSHRLAVAQRAKDKGYSVHIASMSGRSVHKINELGFPHHVISMSRSGKSIFSEVRCLFSIWCLLWKLKPDLLHLVTIKPVLYGGIASRISPVKGVVSAISGLGYIFTALGRRASLLRYIVKYLYKIALSKRNLHVIFQNLDDQRTIVNITGLDMSKSSIIRGSGVDLMRYPVFPEPIGVPVVSLAARLLKDKGICEFIQAARILTGQGLQIKFQLIGNIDAGNPASVSIDELDAWRAEGIVDILGYKKNIGDIFALSNIVVLPSYREGLPKVLVEAAACARSVITTDVPGCRDAIIPNVTGLVVAVRDPTSLADAIAKLAADPVLRKNMGEQGRVLAQRDFDIHHIVEQHIEIYHQLLEGAI